MGMSSQWDGTTGTGGGGTSTEPLPSRLLCRDVGDMGPVNTRRITRLNTPGAESGLRASQLRARAAASVLLLIVLRKPTVASRSLDTSVSKFT